MLKALSALLLGYAARAARKAPAGGAGASEIIGKFEALLDAHSVECWPVRRHAAPLQITPNHLSRLTREEFGCVASRMIRDRILRKARRHLVYTNLPVSTILPISAASSPTPPGYHSREFYERIDIVG